MATRAIQPGRLDVDEVLELVASEASALAPRAIRGELVAPPAERAAPEPPKALTGPQYDRLLREAKARIPDDPPAGARDHAIVLVLGDGGLRCEELAQLQRRDFLPARKGAKVRALDVRHGKG